MDIVGGINLKLNEQGKSIGSGNHIRSEERWGIENNPITGEARVIMRSW